MNRKQIKDDNIVQSIIINSLNKIILVDVKLHTK